MSQASSEFDDLDASGEFESGEFESDVFGSSSLSADDFGSPIGFEESLSDDLSVTADAVGNVEFEDTGAAMAPAQSTYNKQGFSIYTLMLVLSFIVLTATAIIMFTYASVL